MTDWRELERERRAHDPTIRGCQWSCQHSRGRIMAHPERAHWAGTLNASQYHFGHAPIQPRELTYAFRPMAS